MMQGWMHEVVKGSASGSNVGENWSALVGGLRQTLKVAKLNRFKGLIRGSKVVHCTTPLGMGKVSLLAVKPPCQSKSTCWLSSICSELKGYDRDLRTGVGAALQVGRRVALLRGRTAPGPPGPQRTRLDQGLH